jgi:Amino acid synthesis
MKANIRKLVVTVDETHTEMQQRLAYPTRRALAMAVIENPFAGQYVADLSALSAIGEELGGFLGAP